jgi:hypothetical protein
MVIVTVHLDRRGGYKEVPVYRPAPRRTLSPDERQRLEAEHRRLNAAAEKQAGIARHLREVQMVPPADLHRKQQAVRLELAQRREKKIRFAARESAGISRRYGTETALLKLYGDAVHNIANSAVQRVHVSHEAQPLTSERVHALFHRTPPDAAAPRVLSRPSPKRLQGDTEASDYFMPHFGAPPMQPGLHATLALQRASSAGRVRPGTSRNVEHPYQRGSGRPSSRPSSAPVVSSSGALEMKPTQSWQELIFQRGRKAKEEYNKAFIGKTRPSSAASERTSEAAAALAAREAAIAARAQELKEKMAALKTVFKEDGVIHAGNSSQISDGSGALLFMSAEKAKSLGLKPIARVHTACLAGADPVMMLSAPIPATQKVLKRSGLSVDDIGVFEVNEAFAPVPMAWLKEIGADERKLNPNGGAIALGHPLGGSGARIMTTMLYHMRDNNIRYGLQTMCEGGGQANATILELL